MGLVDSGASGEDQACRDVGAVEGANHEGEVLVRAEIADIHHVRRACIDCARIRIFAGLGEPWA